jgi:hypothetical protein
VNTSIFETDRSWKVQLRWATCCQKLKPPTHGKPRTTAQPQKGRAFWIAHEARIKGITALVHERWALIARRRVGSNRHPRFASIARKDACKGYAAGGLRAGKSTPTDRAALRRMQRCWTGCATKRRFEAFPTTLDRSVFREAEASFRQLEPSGPGIR